MLKHSIPASGSSSDSNSFRVGDYVYVEYGTLEPYGVRRISELNRTANGKVAAKVCCFYRREDLPSSLIEFAGNHVDALMDDFDMSPEERTRFKHRELFNSHELETVPSTLIRGKCSVLKFSDLDSPLSYLKTKDVFFYSFLFDSADRTFLCDEGAIRVGLEFQAELPQIQNDEPSQNVETLLWTTNHNLNDEQIDGFVDKAKTVAALARALEAPGVKRNALFLSTVSASRDATLFRAMDVLHERGYSLEAALADLVPPSGPVLARDQLEEWSPAEAELFEKAVVKLGKDFVAIRQDVLPWKSVKNVVEYYYMWKTTDRYANVKRSKAKEAESKFTRILAPKKLKVDKVANFEAKNKMCFNCGVKLTPGAWAPFKNSDVCLECRDYWKRHANFP